LTGLTARTLREKSGATPPVRRRRARRTPRELPGKDEPAELVGPPFKPCLHGPGCGCLMQLVYRTEIGLGTRWVVDDRPRAKDAK
jgi:hypothetical protein